jgi:quinoprotein glucose dehydrogenase
MRLKFNYSAHCLALLASGIMLASSLAYAAEPETNASFPLEPKVADASNDAQDQISTFRKPENLQCDVFAAEPDVANPVTFYVDNKGRVFVCESFRQSNGVTDNRGHDQTWLYADLASRTVSDRIEYHQRLLKDGGVDYTKQDDRIKMLIDKDQDGHVDESVVFASKFNKLEDGTGAGVLVRGNTAYYTNIPNLWQLTDDDGDGVADRRVSLSSGYGVRVAFRGHDMHGLIIGPDGRLYFSIGDRGYHVQTPNGTFANPESGAVFRCELDGSNLEVVATGLRNPQELAFDNHGNLFTGDNNSDSGDKARWVYIVPGSDSGWRMVYQYLTDRGPFNREGLWHPYDKNTTPGYIVPPIANFGDGPSGLTFDPGTGLTDEFRDAFLMVDFRGQASNSGIRLVRNEANGAFFKIKEDSQPFWNMLATDADFGPDGALYVSDWVNGWTGEGKGRIYRFFNADQVASQEARDVRMLLASDFKTLGETALVDLLSHKDRRLRSEAQWELAARYAEKDLLQVAQNAQANQYARLHAVWGLWQIARREHYPESIKTALTQLVSDSDAEVVVAALNVLGESRDPAVGPTVNAAIAHQSPRVIAAAAFAAGRLGLTDCLDPVSAMLTTNGNEDPILRQAGIMAFAGQADLGTIVELKNAPSEFVRLAAVVALRKRDDARVLEFLNDASPSVSLEAVRAVHDNEMLRRHLIALETLDVKPHADPALVRRVMNANYRDGSTDAASRIARLAARQDLAETSRLEAIEMLSKWANPGVTDWVMDRYDPLPDRSAEPAVKAIEANIEALVSASPKVSESALQAAATFGIKSVEQRFRTMLNDEKSTSAAKITALRGLLNSKVADGKSLINKLISSNDTQLRMEALNQLVSIDPNGAMPYIEKAIDGQDIKEKQNAWDDLGRIDSDAAKRLLARGLASYEANSLAPELRLNVIDAASKKGSAETIEKIKALKDARAALRESDPVAFYLDSELGGDAALGKKVFFEKTQLSCVRCHKISTVGGEVGPNLSKIGKDKDAKYLLEAVVAPNAKIAENFKTIIVQTEDGKIYSGILRGETDDGLELMDANGVIIKVAQDNIVGQKEGLSSMPADLMKGMNERELRDLVAFLKTLNGTVDVSEYSQGGHAVE